MISGFSGFGFSRFQFLRLSVFYGFGLSGSARFVGFSNFLNTLSGDGVRGIEEERRGHTKKGRILKFLNTSTDHLPADRALLMEMQKDEIVKKYRQQQN